MSQSAMFSKQSLILFAMSIFLSMVFIDESGVAVTLPHIQRSLHMSNVSIQWVMNGLFLPLAVLVLFGGKVSDHIGYRKTFFWGMFIFICASVCCALAPNGVWEIVGRVGQGVGGSFSLATYAVLLGMVFPGNKRGMALGTCASIASIFLATGPLIGGALAHYLSWRWIFALNVPMGIVCLWAVAQAVSADKPALHDASFDGWGLLWFVLGFSALTYALMQAVVVGWLATLTIALLCVAVVLLPFFYWWEKRQSSPLLDFSLFKIKSFLVGNIVLFCTQVVVLSLTYWALWLQHGLGFSALKAGIGLLPAGLPILLMARLGGKWLDKRGPAGPIGLGSLIVLFGMLWLAYTAPKMQYVWSFWGFLAYGVGVPLIISPAIALVLGSVQPCHIGMAAGIQNTSRQLGAAICFSVVGVVITNINYHGLKSALHLHNVSPELLNRLAHHASALSPHFLAPKMLQQIYTHAFSMGMCVTAIFAAASVSVAILGLKKQ